MSNNGRFLRGVGLVALLIAVNSTSPAFAQGTTAEPDEKPAEDTIVVTGSRIARPNIESAIPITSLSAATLSNAGNVTAGDVVAYVPALFGSVTSELSATRGGILGGAQLNLRGLGAARTLVLVNGRRHVSSSSGSAVVDVNTIPSALIERVDVLTGGASSIYGSDAVSGVVNYVLKKNFSGLELDGQAGISERGDAGTYNLTATYGLNFAGDRGNFVISGQYRKNNPISYGDRDYLRGNQRLDDDANPDLRFQTADLTPALIAAGAFAGQTILRNGAPRFAITPTSLISRATNAAPRRFLPGRNFSISSALGLIGFDADGDFGVDDPNTDFDRNGVNDCSQTFNFAGTGFGCYVVDPSTGRVRPFRDGTIAAFANAFGGDGIPVFLDTENIVPDVEQFNVNAIFNFAVSDAFKPFVEAKFVRTTASDVNNVNSFNDTLPIRLDNPFIPAELLSAVDAFYLANPTANRAAGQILISRDNTDFGTNLRREQRDTFRIVGGATGDLGSGFGYEVSVNYGQTKTTTVQEHVRLEDRFYAALDAVRVNGQLVCRSSVNANVIPGTSPFPAYDADPNGNGVFEPATFRTNDGTCRPLNLFGLGAPSEASVNFVAPPSTSRSKLEQLVVQGVVTGSSEAIFSLPGGPVRFVIGGEYRREKSIFTPDPLDAAGLQFESGAQPEQGSFDVKESFAEIEIPIAKNIPFIELLTLNGSARYSDYSLAQTNKVFTWGVNGIYAPISDIRFRGGFSRAIRAPNITDIFGPTTPATFRPIDVCDATQINRGNNPARRLANCRADGIPAGFTDPLTARITGLTGSNPGLREETSNSFTYGVVVQPSFIRGLTASADYWNYKITQAIAAVSANEIVQACYDSADFPNNGFCRLFTRNRNSASPTFLGFNTFRSSPVNFARFNTDGIDVQVDYAFELGNIGKISARVGGTYVRNSAQFTSALDPTSNDPSVGEAQEPQIAFNTGLAFTKNGFRIEWQSFWESKQFFQGIEVEDPGAFATPNRTNDFWSHNINMSYEVTDNLKFRLGVRNLTNERPFAAEAAYPVSAIGRSFFFGATANY